MSMLDYDVSISFRGEDPRNDFVDQLYNTFKQNGIRVYRDDSDLYSDTGKHSLHKVYEKSMFSIVIFYQQYRYLSSYLREVVYLFTISINHKFMPILNKIKPEEVAYQTGCVGEALAIDDGLVEGEELEWSIPLSIADTFYGATFCGWQIIETTNGYQSYIDKIIEGLFKLIYEESSGCKGFESISPLERRLSIHWDFQNSPIPNDVIPEDIIENTVAFVRRETKINWKVDDVYAYGDFSNIISNIQKVKLHHSGVMLIDTPRVKKDTTYNALLVALFKWARNCPPPSTIMLITGNIYFANTLHALRRLGHNIILAISSEVGVSTPLINASNYNWYWSNVAKGPTSSSQVQIEELPDDNYNWYRSNLVKGEDLESIRQLERRLFIAWDLENCSIPGEVHAKDVFKNILAFVKRATKIDWEAVSVSAYAEMSRIDRKVRAYLQGSGVDLIDTPHVKKDAADDAMIVDLFMDSNYFPPPSSIMVITGDVDFARTLNELARFGHDIFLAIPFVSGVSKSLINASKYCWSWSDVANGIEERSHVDLNGLKGQLVELLKSHGGELSLGSLLKEYLKEYKKPLRVSKYKAKKLVDLLKKMSDVISVEVLNGETSVKLKG